jgi:hypothetical protein
VDTERAEYVAACYADGGGAAEQRAPVFSSELGLAVESTRDGLTLEQLWGVV